VDGINEYKNGIAIAIKCEGRAARAPVPHSWRSQLTPSIKDCYFYPHFLT
jgi:hypothetical protein